MKHSNVRQFPRRGAALIIVLAVLAVLALLGTVFAGINVIEKKVSLSYLDEIRARLIARSGVERAVTEIQAGIGRGVPDDVAMQFWGNNMKEEGAPDFATPLTRAKNPSYAWEDEDPQDPLNANKSPMMFGIDNDLLGVSGFMGTGQYAANGDVYRLQVVDANSRINVNDGVEYGNTHNVSKNLARILDNLGLLLGVKEMGKRIIDLRPITGYKSKRELEKIFAANDYVKISQHLTVNSWSDNNVVNPVPLSAECLSLYPIHYNERINLYRYGRSRKSDGQQIDTPLLICPELCNFNLGFGQDTGGGFSSGPPQSVGAVPNAIIALDELNVQYVERVRRSPVNVNAASMEVLTALITDLRGFWVAGRRKHNLAANLYSFLFHTKYDCAPGGHLGDEIGFIYSTPSFKKKAEVDADAIVTADDVAEEIIACRSKQHSPHCPTIDYSTIWYGGPFKTWRQFYAFCDGLVTGGLLKDPRNIYFDYQYPTSTGGGFMNFNTPPEGSQMQETSPSPIQRDLCVQAMADVLKANFNPNFTPNEANPDHNLCLEVDKTDLLSNTTEFCFTPMGIFDIESEGLVMQTVNQQDFLKCKKGHVVARRRIAVTIKAYDAYRESTQADFYKGEFGRRPAGSAVTNNNKTMETGPECDNGPAPQEDRASGWIQLSTNGGPWIGNSAGHFRGGTQPTPVGHSELGDVMHGHFCLDHRLHFHADQNQEDPLLTPLYQNQPDRTEQCMGPYGPVQGLPGQYRICRDYTPDKLPDNPQYHATSDMRVDGAYIERDCALMYHASTAVFNTRGTVAYWLKPSFHPAMTGKPRTFFSMDAVSSDNHQLINGQWFFASHDAPAYQTSPHESVEPNYNYTCGPWRPTCMAAGFSPPPTGFGGVGCESQSLNHRGHSDKNKKDDMAQHKWIHVAYYWEMDGLDYQQASGKAMLLINGKLNGDSQIWVHPSPGGTSTQWMSAAPNTTVRLGEPSTSALFTGSFWGNPGRMRNWTADATMDEFYMWQGKQFGIAGDLYSKGRYYRARPGREAQFTSAPLPLVIAPRKLAPPSSSLPPTTGHDTVADGAIAGGHASYGGGTTAVVNPQIRILGATWTWYPEEIDSRGEPYILDHYSDTHLKVDLQLQIIIDGEQVGPSMTLDAGDFTQEILCTQGQEVKYRFKVSFTDGNANTITQSSPMIDDVTVYFTTGTSFLSYELID